MTILNYMRYLLLVGVMVMSPLGAVKSDAAANGTGLSAEKVALGEELVGALKESAGVRKTGGAPVRL